MWERSLQLLRAGTREVQHFLPFKTLIEDIEKSIAISANATLRIFTQPFAEDSFYLVAAFLSVENLFSPLKHQNNSVAICFGT